MKTPTEARARTPGLAMTDQDRVGYQYELKVDLGASAVALTVVVAPTAAGLVVYCVKVKTQKTKHQRKRVKVR